MEKKNLRQIGAGYERIAAGYLEEQGYRILERNFRCRLGEIDLIAAQGGILVFVEVKFRSGGRCGDPFEAVDKRKQRVICRCADYYRISRRIRGSVSCRFDVVGISGSRIRLIQNAFAYIPFGQ